MVRTLLAATTAAALVAAAVAPGASATKLSRPGIESTYAFVDRSAVARTSPSSSARRVGRLTTRTREKTDELVGVLESRTVRGVEWLRVQLPIKPTGATGWVPRATVGELRTVTTHLRIDRRTRKATLIESGRVVFTAPVGIGKAGTATPGGSFYVRSRLVPSRPDGLYGALAFGTSARSPFLTDWPGGGYIGIHGTNQPGILPGRVSNGCIRMRNEDILKLDTLMTVGTPVSVV